VGPRLGKIFHTIRRDQKTQPQHENDPAQQDCLSSSRCWSARVTANKRWQSGSQHKVSRNTDGSTAGTHTVGRMKLRDTHQSAGAPVSRVDRNAVLRICAATLESASNPSLVAKKFASAIAAHYFYQPTGSESDEYHKWYYNTAVWMKTTWAGVKCWKSVSDMWNYQEILFELKPSLVVEFGTAYGGSALFFADVMRRVGLGAPFKVVSVDIYHGRVDQAARQDPDILLIESRSTVPAVAERIRCLRNEFPGTVFAILDSDHSMNHVLAEMKLLRPLLAAGDYLVVEDSQLNGHPAHPGWGPGPFEAIEAYEQEFPHDYRHDVVRETKFGWTQATNGFLIRN
jgi:cephalosporin hydroxylase